MYTVNKIRVAERDALSSNRRTSGGVKDPSSPQHYPKLAGSVSNADAHLSETRLRRLTGSFKESLLSEAQPSLTEFQFAGDEHHERDPESSSSRSSPQIAAGRPASYFQSDESLTAREEPHGESVADRGVSCASPSIALESCWRQLTLQSYTGGTTP